MVPPLEADYSLPSMASTLVRRLVLVIATSWAFHVCMSKPNPPPDVNDLKQVSRLENTSKYLLEPLARVFSLAPAIIEFMGVFSRFALPPTYDIFSDTCMERMSFSVPALVGCVLSVCGTGIRLWCYQELGPLYTFELTLFPHHALITTGPYAIVRHPAYAGGLLALVGMTIVNVSKGSWAYECGALFSWWGVGWGTIASVSTIVVVERCPREDRLLRDTFPEKWDAWRERVRWRMVPWVF